MTVDKIDAYCRASRDLAQFKRPRRITFVDSLQTNPSGKVLKRELIASLGKAAADERAIKPACFVGRPWFQLPRSRSRARNHHVISGRNQAVPLYKGTAAKDMSSNAVFPSCWPSTFSATLWPR
jgi:hypothetical protein